MTLLRRVLKTQSAVWAIVGLACLAAPGAVAGALGVDATDDAVLRLLGIAAVVLAMAMVLVSQHLPETWWWAWAFALLEAGVATVCVLRALTAAPGTPTAAWWIAGVASIAFGALDLLGLARAEQAKPFA